MSAPPRVLTYAVEPEPPKPTTATANAKTVVITAPTTSTAPAPAPVPTPVVTDDESEARDPARVAMVIAFLLAGAGLLVAQLPYGRFGTLGACVVGGLLGASAWFGSQRPKYPAIATALNALVLLVACFLPGWLGIGSWRPEPPAKDMRTVQIVGADGFEKPKSDWLDIGQTWQFDDVRVRASAVVGPIEMIGPKGQAAWSKKSFFVVHIRVANVGVARAIDFHGWDGQTAGKLVDAAGTIISPAKFEAGWVPADHLKTASITPGHSADWILYFEMPTTPTEFFRIELPGAPCGVPENPVRFQIPARPLGIRFPQ
ncbi:MAG TPA: hypothetical protein VHR66_03760 [Gemmataceae bacterium]|nr:hypothetical protein [Gemmataceae bacterium]